MVWGSSLRRGFIAALLSFVSWVLPGTPGLTVSAESWSAEFINPVFGSPTFGASVTAVAASGTDYYIGGSFTRIGNILDGAGSLAANGIARWDGRQWHPLGSGVEEFVNPLLDGTVHAIAVHGSDVYVGGTFTVAGGAPASRIARWDGNQWWPLGPGLNGAVQSITVQGDDIYVGGSFSAAGDVVLNGIGRWNGTAWSPLGSGLAANFRIRSIVVHDGRVYAGGNFFVIQPGGTLLLALAQWDGENWTSVGAGVSQDVNALAVYQGALIAGGQFTTAGNVPVNRIARWDGSAWSPLGTGVSGGILTGVSSLLPRGDELLVAGNFITAGDTAVTGLARWNGTEWAAYADRLVTALGADGSVSALAGSSGGVLAAGDFGQAGDSVVPGLAQWNGTDWAALGEGIAGSIQAIHATENGTYVGGLFSTAGGLRVNSIARRQAGRWQALGGGVLSQGQPGVIRAITSHGTDVYVGGSFTVAGNISATNIARWNGTAWEPLDGGLFGGPGAIVLSLAVAPNGDLVAGGVFNQAGEVPVRNIARWNGSSWSALGEGLVADVGGAVQALAFLGEDLFAGGAFSQPVPLLARWNGTAWSDAGGSPNSTVLALAVHAGQLYAGGYFTTIGSVAAQRIARWEGAAWSALGDGVGASLPNDYVTSVAVSDAGVFVAGVFTNSGPVSVNRIARFDGSEWSPLGSGITAGPFGMDPFVYGLGIQGGELLVGGAFVEAGGLPASSVSVWYLTPGPSVPELAVAKDPEGSLVLTWSSVPGTQYQLEATASLTQAFVPLGEPVEASSATVQVTIPESAASSQWYRVEVLP